MDNVRTSAMGEHSYHLNMIGLILSVIAILIADIYYYISVSSNNSLGISYDILNIIPHIIIFLIICDGIYRFIYN